MRTVQLYDGNGKLLSETPLPADPALDNADALPDLLRNAMAAMQAIIDTPDVAFANIANAQVAMRNLQAQVRQEARLLRRLIRLAVGDLTGTD